MIEDVAGKRWQSHQLLGARHIERPYVRQGQGLQCLRRGAHFVGTMLRSTIASSKYENPTCAIPPPR